MTFMRDSCLIIGAGIAGLTSAGVLRNSGWDVLLLDKEGCAGGRMATRHIEPSLFDHGAQFFTVRDPRFRSQMEEWEACGWVTPWFSDGGHVRYRGTASMNAIAKELAQPFEVITQTRAERALPEGRGWRVLTESGQEFSAASLLLTPPVPQSMALLGAVADRLPAVLMSDLKGIGYDSCFALLAVMDGPALVPSPGFVKPSCGPIAWIADNARKGISPGPSALTIHARADFTRAHFDAPRDQVAELLLAAAQPWLGSQVMKWQLHRWKYSRPVSTTEASCVYTSAPAPLAFAGDAFGGPRIEGAFLSGLAAAERLLATGR